MQPAPTPADPARPRRAAARSTQTGPQLTADGGGHGHGDRSGSRRRGSVPDRVLVSPARRADRTWGLASASLISRPAAGRGARGSTTTPSRVTQGDRGGSRRRGHRGRRRPQPVGRGSSRPGSTTAGATRRSGAASRPLPCPRAASPIFGDAARRVGTGRGRRSARSPSFWGLTRVTSSRGADLLDAAALPARDGAGRFGSPGNLEPTRPDGAELRPAPRTRPGTPRHPLSGEPRRSARPGVVDRGEHNEQRRHAGVDVRVGAGQRDSSRSVQPLSGSAWSRSR